MNEANSISGKFSVDTLKNYKKSLNVRTALRYVTLMTIIISVWFSSIPRAGTHATIIFLTLYPFLYSLQIFYEFYTLAAELVKNVLLNLCTAAISTHRIRKMKNSLIFVNQHKNHLQDFYSFIFLPVFGTVFISLNCNVSVTLTIHPVMCV